MNIQHNIKISQIAEEAGIEFCPPDVYKSDLSSLVEFAKQIRNEALEQAAGVVDIYTRTLPEAASIVSTIRAVKEK